MNVASLQGKHGVVILRDHFWYDKDGSAYQGVIGTITVVPAKDAMGFDVNNRDANWIAIVEGETTQVVLPGCTVGMFHIGDNLNGDAYYEVP